MARLAEETDGSLRLAIDASLWLHQVLKVSQNVAKAIAKQNQQSARGNQDERSMATKMVFQLMFYRLCKLLGYGFRVCFVYDGDQRPEWKRSRRTFHFTSRELDGLQDLAAAFGFGNWQAPGEAEAECAVMQCAGIVDVVVTEDVDGLLFGATCIWREFGSVDEGADKAPVTHVSVYEDVTGRSGLTPDGLKLVALVSGGDYLPKGIPKLGPVRAVELARAGYGETLLTSSCENRYRDWREEVEGIVRRNEDKVLSRRLKEFQMPIDFPDPQIVEYYARPVVSTPEILFSCLVENTAPDVELLCKHVQRLMSWHGTTGRSAFYRIFSPMYLQYCLRSTTTGHCMVSGIHSTRKHASTDHMLECRVSYVPSNVLAGFQLDFGREADDVIIVSDEDAEERIEDAQKKQWDEHTVQRIWLAETLVVKSAPEIYREWQKAQEEKSNRRKLTTKKTETTKKKPMQENKIDRYFAAGRPKTATITSSKLQHRRTSSDTLVSLSPTSYSQSHSPSLPSPTTLIRASPSKQYKATATEIVHLLSSTPPSGSPAEQHHPRQSSKTLGTTMTPSIQRIHIIDISD